MISLSRFSVQNPVLVNIAMIAILVGGVYSGLTMTRELFPEFNPNRIMIATPYPGASPAEVEKGITLKIEEAIKGVEGIEKISSTVTEGRSTIDVELRSDFEEIEEALDDIKAAVDTIPRDDFPEEALETQVYRFDPRWPVISVSLFGDLDDRSLKLLGERLRDDILSLPEVSDVELGGVRKDEISVEVAPSKLVQYGVSFPQVAQAVASSNLDLPGGQIKTGVSNVAVRTLGEKGWGEDLYDVVVRSTPDGGMVTLGDVATIVDGFEDADVIGRFNAKSSSSVTIYKSEDQDAILIANMVNALVAGKMRQPLERSWTDLLMAKLSSEDVIRDIYDRAYRDPFPPGVELMTHSDLSRFISGRLDLLKRNGTFGLLLVFLTLFLLLHWRVAMWVMLGLLMAIAGALVMMSFLGMTLNLMTMFGLIIVLGLLVDDAIIVAENVYSKVEEGVEPRLAAIEGSEEVTWPVVCAILTTIVAFMPLMDIKSQLGDWMGVLPVVVCVALSVSLIEALSILPSHLAHGIRPLTKEDSSSSRKRLGPLDGLSRRVRFAQERFVKGFLLVHYERLVRLATRYRYVTMSLMASSLIVMLGLVAGGHVPFVFLQKMDSETILAKVEMGVGAPVEETSRAVLEIEKQAMKLEEFRSVQSLIGAQLSVDLAGGFAKSHVAQLFIELTETEQRDRPSIDIIQDLRAATNNIPGVERLKYEPLQGGPGGAAIHLEISGERIEDLVAVSETIKRRLSEFEGVFDITDDFDAGRREVKIELLESGKALGMTTESLAWQVRSAFYGYEARKIQRDREDVKIMVRYPEENRRAVYDIESMYVATPAGHMVPFREVAVLKEGSGYSTIKRKDQERTITILADVDDAVTNSGTVIAALSDGFEEIYLEYPGVKMEFGGRKLESNKAFSSLNTSFIVTILLIYVILAGLFKSYVQPLVVMVAIPFGFIGAVAGHFVLGSPLTVMSMIGLVALSGIVANDSLILVSFINDRIRDGVNPAEAVIEAAKRRLRPILLTSATTVLGLAPLLMERSFQAKFLIPMGISVSAGLIFATVLTLIAVPALFMIVLDIKGIWSSGWNWLLGREPETARGDGCEV